MTYKIHLEQHVIIVFLVGDRYTIIPEILKVTATASDDGEVQMAIEHKDYLIQGVQFKALDENIQNQIMTEDGKKINYLTL